MKKRTGRFPSPLLVAAGAAIVIACLLLLWIRQDSEERPEPSTAEPVSPHTQPVPASPAPMEALRADVHALRSQVEVLTQRLGELSDELHARASGRESILPDSRAGAPFEPEELSALRELSEARDVLLYRAEESGPAYRWERKRERIAESARTLAKRHGISSATRLNDELLNLSLERLSLDNRRAYAVASGVSQTAARLEWEDGWHEIQTWMEGRLVTSGLCDEASARDVALDALLSCQEFSGNPP